MISCSARFRIRYFGELRLPIGVDNGTPGCFPANAADCYRWRPANAERLVDLYVSAIDRITLN
jgi:hypothetical protein